MNTSNCWKLCQHNSLSAAETFNNYFCEVATSDRDCREMVEFVKVAPEKTRDNCFNLVPVDVSYMRKIWGTLDPGKAIGCDKISQRLLRLSSPVIAEPITRVINYFITNRQWPLVRTFQYSRRIVRRKRPAIDQFLF